MRVIAAIRTHRWDEDAVRIAAQLRPVFGDDLVTVFHNRPAGLETGTPIVDVNNKWLRRNGLRVLSDWGWRCGDYFAYALRRAYPDADRYWLIEPDVWFSRDPAGFFDQANVLDGDLLAGQVVPVPADHRFARGMPGVATYRGIFALTRFSGRALDRLFKARQDYASAPAGSRFYANDEVFCHSTVMADPELTLGSLADHLPDWLPEGSMRTDPDVLIDVLTNADVKGVFHPVRARATFKQAVAARVASPPGFLAAMQPSLVRLSARDIDEIAADVGRRTAIYLRDAAGMNTTVADEAAE
jgi:hypothetical protein